MHEPSVADALVRRVEAEVRKHAAARVRGLTLRIGELAGVEPALLETAYKSRRVGTRCQGAELRIVAVPARWRCAKCRHEVQATAGLRCPECRRPASLTAGDELLLEQIELEVARVRAEVEAPPTNVPPSPRANVRLSE